MKLADIDIAVSGKYWVGNLGGSILTATREISENAKNEIQMTIYSFGKNIPEFLEIIRDLLKKNIRIQLVINKFNNQPIRVIHDLLKLMSQYQNLTLLDFNPPENEDLHAKIMVVDRTWALIGSSNISWHGYISNHELAIIINGEFAENIAKLVDKLAQSPVSRLINHEGR